MNINGPVVGLGLLVAGAFFAVVTAFIFGGAVEGMMLLALVLATGGLLTLMATLP